VPHDLFSACGAWPMHLNDVSAGMYGIPCKFMRLQTSWLQRETTNRTRVRRVLNFMCCAASQFLHSVQMQSLIRVWSTKQCQLGTQPRHGYRRGSRWAPSLRCSTWCGAIRQAAVWHSLSFAFAHCFVWRWQVISAGCPAGACGSLPSKT
jgi:hypothetical protein